MASRSSVTHSLFSRRHFLWKAGGGLGGIALAHLLGQDNALAMSPSAATNPLAPKRSHFSGKAKRVIWLFMHGGPSSIDLFDPKMNLWRYEGQPLPDSVGPVTTRRQVARNPLMAPVKSFQTCGQSGMAVSDFLPHMGELVDEMCFIRSCHGDSVNHPQAVYQVNTGSVLMGKPSVGSWVAYGLGSENQNMPAFVVMPDPGSGPKGGPPAWGSGFLPATYQGTTMRPGPNPILNLQSPAGVTADRQRSTIDLLQRLNEGHLAERAADDELQARINSYELAFRMQSAAPGVVDLNGESEVTKKMYGIDEPVTREFGTRCLQARRMIERGVRFVQLYSGDTNGWDAHNDLVKNHTDYCARTDKPVAGLIRDLQQRGLLEDTLVIWGGEFGRMPMSEKGTGRDHNPWGYTTILAGAGVKKGIAYGNTDDFGLRAVENPVHVHDLHATILHLLGFDHERLTYHHDGKKERLTDVFGNVVTGILA